MSSATTAGKTREEAVLSGKKLLERWRAQKQRDASQARFGTLDNQEQAASVATASTFTSEPDLASISRGDTYASPEARKQQQPMKQRASWAPAPPLADPPSSAKLNDLSSVAEEDEEEEDEEHKESLESVAELPNARGSPQSKRPRPASLFFQPTMRRTTNAIAENGTPTSGKSFNTHPPYDSAVSLEQDAMYHRSNASKDSPSRMQSQPATTQPRRGLRPLSLSLSTSVNNPPGSAGGNNNPGSPAVSTPGSHTDSAAVKQQRRQSGLRALAAANSSLPESPNNSAALADLASPPSASASSAVSAAFMTSPLANKRQSVMASMNALNGVGRASSSRTNSIISSGAGSSIPHQTTSIQAKRSSLSYISANGEPAAPVQPFQSRRISLQESELTPSEIAFPRFSGVPESSRSSRETQLEAQVSDLQAQLADAQAERDSMVEDISDWRTRCADLTSALEREKKALEAEKKDGALARDRVRKLGDRLATMNTSRGEQEQEDALVSAQAKLINEMRDQIFTLAGTLEQEKREHANVLSRHQQLQQEHEEQQQAHQREQQQMQMAAYTPSPRGGDFDTSATSSSFLQSSLRNSLISDEMSFTSQSSIESKPDLSSSLNASGSQGLQQPNGGLDTLAEEEEGDEDDELRGYEDEEAGDELADLEARQAFPDAARSTCSSVSTPDACGPPTPPLGAEPTHMSPVQATNNAKHERSESFFKTWTFPRGSVTPLRTMEPEDHSFFAISTADVLPPLPVSHGMAEASPILESALVYDEEEAVRQSWDSVNPPTVSPLESHHSLPSRTFSPPQQRQSFQPRYSQLPRQSSQHQQLKKLVDRRFARRPMASPLSRLDFTRSCGVSPEQVLHI